MPIEQALIEEIQLLNPWLGEENAPIFPMEVYFSRLQESYLLDKEWDGYWLVLIGPRQTGKTTLSQHLIRRMIQQKRFSEVLYLNCDFTMIRTQLTSAVVVKELIDFFKLTHPIIFIDEVQRLENPGLLLKSLVDLHLPMKLIASGSSQLEMKSKIQEYLKKSSRKGISCLPKTRPVKGIKQGH